MTCPTCVARLQRKKEKFRRQRDDLRQALVAAEQSLKSLNEHRARAEQIVANVHEVLDEMGADDSVSSPALTEDPDKRLRRFLDPDDELSRARRAYFAAGGMESDLGPRDDAKWYWRRAARLAERLGESKPSPMRSGGD